RTATHTGRRIRSLGCQQGQLRTGAGRANGSPSGSVAVSPQARPQPGTRGQEPAQPGARPRAKKPDNHAGRQQGVLEYTESLVCRSTAGKRETTGKYDTEANLSAFRKKRITDSFPPRFEWRETTGIAQ